MAKAKDLPLFDAAEYLTTPKMQADYISEVMEFGTPDEIRKALRTVARARGMVETAKAAGITREGLYKALGESGNPEFGTVLAIMRALGLKLAAVQAPAKRPARKKKKAA